MTYMMKNNPAMPPTGTHSEIALGSFVVGSSHSSAIEAIIPNAEKLFTVSWKRPLVTTGARRTCMQMAACQ